jgi:hypothetical protein
MYIFFSNSRWVAAEGTKYDVERDVHIKEMQIHDLEMEVIGLN